MFRQIESQPYFVVNQRVVMLQRSADTVFGQRSQSCIEAFRWIAVTIWEKFFAVQRKLFADFQWWYNLQKQNCADAGGK